MENNLTPTLAQTQIFREVQTIIDRKKIDGIAPAHASPYEIMQGSTLTPQEVRDVLELLVIKEMLVSGVTINGKYYKPNTPE